MYLLLESYRPKDARSAEGVAIYIRAPCIESWVEHADGGTRVRTVSGEEWRVRESVDKVLEEVVQALLDANAK